MHSSRLSSVSGCRARGEGSVLGQALAVSAGPRPLHSGAPAVCAGQECVRGWCGTGHFFHSGPASRSASLRATNCGSFFTGAV